MGPLRLLSAGAAKGIVTALVPAFRDATGATIECRFGAVGTMRDLLVGGAPCDAIILTAAMLLDLARKGRIEADSLAPLGGVHTGIAVRESDRRPDVGTAAALWRALAEADAIYVPDVERSTAGAHFLRVARSLGLDRSVRPQLHAYPNGAEAMAALAASTAARPIGCTQVTEIRYTPGVALVGNLPREFDLVTEYGVAIVRSGNEADLAKRFLTMLTGAPGLALRANAGFEIARGVRV